MEEQNAPTRICRCGWRLAKSERVMARLSSVTNVNGEKVSGQSGCISKGATERAVVVTMIVAVTGFDPSSATDDGETEQVAIAGAPLQLNATVWLNPAIGFRVIE